MEKVMADIEMRDNDIYRAYFDANPIPEEQRRAGFGGVNRYNALEGFSNSEQIISTTKKIDILSRMLVVQSKSLEEIQALAEKKDEFFGSNSFHSTHQERRPQAHGFRLWVADRPVY